MNMQKILKTNYHTHTTFCDGSESAEDMAKSALSKGFDILGFSGHSMYPFASAWHIAPRSFDKYVEVIQNIKTEYDGRMQVLCGFEADYVPGFTIPRMSDYTQFKPDYLIGSVHYIVNENGNFCADDNAENLQKGIKKLFNGNIKEAVCTYFALQREMLQKGDFAIWGHPDVIRKQNWKLNLFNEEESWYRSELIATANSAKHSNVIAEINTGAIARGTMDDVYPSADFLAILHDTGIPVMINSDAHRSQDLDCAFDRAAAAAKKAGYVETMFIDGGTIKSQKL
ncbi:MAG: histidinol-phosphatase [Treponema sp.]|nr:histidinol-phosphatase [Treponema sp.]